MSLFLGIQWYESTPGNGEFGYVVVKIITRTDLFSCIFVINNEKKVKKNNFFIQVCKNGGYR